MIDSLIIVGGGTSGLVASLMLKSGWPNLDITVLESSNVGTIGVGEGTTEHWKLFMDHVGIYSTDLFREAGATYKVGVKFTNWHGDGTHYWHSLAEQLSYHTAENGLPYVFLRMISDGFDPKDIVWKLSAESRHVEPLHNVMHQFHFDANKLNDFLHKVARARGIKFIDTYVEDVELDERGYVSALIDKDNKRYSSDFYIDCSGYKRVIGSKLNVNWVDCQEELPMNSAIAFMTPTTEDIPSYSEATAMSSGWMWRIPTQERFGNGYVFCDSFINEEQAEQELRTVHDEVNVARRIKFRPGYVDKFWVKNCVMLGLSSMFVEPLEASSISATIQQCLLLLPALFSYSNDDGGKTSNRYNKAVNDIVTNIVDFIQLHYLTERNDSEFWRWCKTNIKLTDFNVETLDYFKNNFVCHHYLNSSMLLFNHLNWAQLMHGLRMFNTERIKQSFDKHLPKYRLQTDYEFNLDDERNRTIQTYSHREAIEILKGRYEQIAY
jgi:tryptophan halogenase